MGLQIEDGKGTGHVAQVDDENRLRTLSTIITDLENASDLGDGYSITNLTYNYSAGDTILAIKNTDDDRHFHVDRVFVSGDTATQVVCHTQTSEITMAGTAVVEHNMNTTSGKTAAMTSIADETGNSAIGNIIASVFIQASAGFVFELDGAVILGANKFFGVDFVSVGTGAVVTILGHYARD